MNSIRPPAPKYSSPTLRPPTIVAWPSAVNALLCMRRFRRGVANSGEGLGVVGYQPARRTWHRDFIDHNGFVLELDGQIAGV